MTLREFRRILLADLPLAESQGWHAVSREDGAAKVDVVGGNVEVVLVERELPPDDDDADLFGRRHP